MHPVARIVQQTVDSTVPGYRMHVHVARTYSRMLHGVDVLRATQQCLSNECVSNLRTYAHSHSECILLITASMCDSRGVGCAIVPSWTGAKRP